MPEATQSVRGKAVIQILQNQCSQPEQHFMPLYYLNSLPGVKN